MIETILLILAVLAVLILAPGIARLWTSRRQDEPDTQYRNGHDSHVQSGGADEPGTIERRLLGAGLSLGPIWLVLLMVVFGLLGFTFFLKLVPGAIWLGLLVAALIGYLPWVVISEIAGFRARWFEEKLVDGIDLIVGALQAGEVPERALASAAELSDRPVRGELQELVSRLSLGMSIERATARIPRRYDCEGAQLFVQTLIAKWQTGGDLAPVLNSVNAIMRERLRLRLRLKGQLAGAGLSAILIAILPYLLIPVFAWRKPGWLNTLVEHPMGPHLLTVAVLLQILGFLWLRRLMKVRL